MTDALGDTLGFAIGVAVSPIPIAAVILMLFSGRARSNSVAFLFAWVVGIALVASIVVAVGGFDSDDAEPSRASGWFRLVLGLLLLVGAARQWRSRPAPGTDPEPPPWMTKIDELRPPAAFGLGFLLSAVNPKNLLLSAAAGAAISARSLPGGEAAGAIAVFTAIASLSVALPVVAYLVAGRRLDPALDRTKNWLVTNNAAVMSVLFLVFAANLVGEAITILT